MATKTVKNTETENKETKTTAKPKAEKPKATTKKEKTKTVQTSELLKQEQTTEPTADTTAVVVPEQDKQETDVFSKEFVKQAVKEKNKIAIEYGKVEQSYWNIARSVHWLHDNNGFKPLGYQNIYDLAKQEFGIARGTTCGFINIVDRFGKRDELGNFTGKIDNKYEAYSFSKLLLLLDLTDEEIEKLPPTLSVREMKKKIKLMLADSESTTESVTTGGNGFSQSFDEEETENFESTTESVTTGGNGFSQSFDGEETENFEITRQALIACTGLEDYQGKVDDIDEYILKAFKAHPDARIEIVLVTAQSAEETADSTEEE